MQNQELFAKLALARQAQIRALRRFAHAQQRLTQLEQRQQALHTLLHASITPLDQEHLPVSTPLPGQVPETESGSQNPAFLPESGELELLEDFAPAPQTDSEQTDRIAPQTSLAPQTDSEQTDRIIPLASLAPSQTPVPQTTTTTRQETGTTEATVWDALIRQAEEQL